MNEKNNAVNQAGRHTSAPSPAAGFEVLLITGMSGAGRSHAANSIEDMGWYVVDNMPPKLLVPLVDMMTSSGSNIHKLAAVIDVRSRDYFDDLSAVLSHLDDLGVKTRHPVPRRQQRGAHQALRIRAQAPSAAAGQSSDRRHP